MVEELPPEDALLIPVRLDACEPQDELLKELHWVDLFPSYQDGLARILRVLTPASQQDLDPEVHQKQQNTGKIPSRLPVTSLRNEPMMVTEEEFQKIFGLDGNGRPREYIPNQFEDQGEVIMDHATSLMWQKAGSYERLTYQEAQDYINRLNQKRFAGYEDWYLPTIPELMSLLEPEKNQVICISIRYLTAINFGVGA